MKHRYFSSILIAFECLYLVMLPIYEYGCGYDTDTKTGDSKFFFNNLRYGYHNIYQNIKKKKSDFSFESMNFLFINTIKTKLMGKNKIR